MVNYPDFVFLNGTIVPHQDAKISVFDRGFIFGDGVYEAMVKINGQFFYGDAHLGRLASSLQKINIHFDISGLPKDIDRLLAASDLENEDCLLYIQISRGVAPRKHGYPDGAMPTLMMYALPYKLPEINNKHMAVVTTPDFRWHRCDIKMTSLLGNIMVNQFAMENDAYEAILVRNGVITEASHSNIFFVKNQVVYTHPANELILNGISRQVVVALCHQMDLNIIEEGIKQDDITRMDEAFLTGTTTQVAAIQRIDAHYYFKDAIGPITRKLQEAFLELKNQENETKIII